MRKLFPLIALIAAGCTPKTEPADTAVATPPASGGGIAPMTTGAAGGLTPVTGSESVEGPAGGGVNQAAMGAAQRAAAKAGSSPSTGNEGGE